jgi:hypothetical protein
VELVHRPATELAQLIAAGDVSVSEHFAATLDTRRRGVEPWATMATRLREAAAVAGRVPLDGVDDDRAARGPGTPEVGIVARSVADLALVSSLIADEFVPAAPRERQLCQPGVDETCVRVAPAGRRGGGPWRDDLALAAARRRR